MSPPRTHAATGPPGSGRVLTQFELPSEPGNEREAIARVERAIAGLDLDGARLERLKTAVGEATMNAIEHGNGNVSECPVTVVVLHERDLLRVRIADLGGPPVDAGARERPDIEAKLAGTQSPRGWGLFLIDSMVDETRVTSDGAGHTLELILRLADGHGDA